MRSLPRVPALAALALIVLPAALAAQAAGQEPAPTRPPGCRGTMASTASVSAPRPNGPPIEWDDYPVIEDVQTGSPAESAGMLPGDKILMMDGHDLVASPPTKTFLAGDTVQFVVWRNNTEVPLTVVLGRWDPPEAPEGVTRICRPLGTPASGRD